MDLLFEKLNAITKLSPKLKSYLIDRIETLPFRKHTYTPYTSLRSSTFYFVVSGTLGGIRVSDTEDLPLILFSQGDFIIPSLTQPRKDFINDLSFYTAAVLLAITIDDAKHALASFPEAFLLFSGIIDKHIHDGNMRELLLRLPPQERFNSLFITRPHLLLQCNSIHIAAYLNVSKRQLMRLKKISNDKSQHKS